VSIRPSILRINLPILLGCDARRRVPPPLRSRSCSLGEHPDAAWLPREYIADFRAKIDVYRRLSRAIAASQIDELAAELADRFGPPPDEAQRLLDFGRLRVAAVALGIDSITRHPGMVVIGHHDGEALERLRQAAAKKNRVVRVVDQKTAVVPLHADTLADPDKLVASLQRTRDKIGSDGKSKVASR
jgi:transcription-repair coupling factor (superfamily II helicase)